MGIAALFIFWLFVLVPSMTGETLAKITFYYRKKLKELENNQ